MTTRQINSVLWFTAAILAIGATVVLLFGLFTPLESAGGGGHTPAPAGAAGVSSTNTVPSMDSPMLDRKLRVSLTDAPVQTTATAPVAVTAPPLELVGMIGDSLVMIRTPDGLVAAKRVGDSIAGGEVLAIRPNRVDIRLSGRTLTLEKAAEPITNP